MRISIACCCVLWSPLIAVGGIRTFDFDDGTLQGWNYVNVDGDPYPVGNPDETGVGWKVSDEDIALGEDPSWFLLQGTSVHGTGSPGNPQRVANPRVIPDPWDNRDCGGALQCQTQILQSPIFKLDDSGPISVDFIGGQAQGERSFDPAVDDPPLFPQDHDFYKGADGWQGYALYDVGADEYVRWGFPTILNDGKQRDGREVWETVSLSREDLAEFANDGKDYRLDIFDSYAGGWGWVGFDTVQLPDAELPAIWTGAGEDNLWTNPANWNSGVPSGGQGEVYINAPAAQGTQNGPLITEGMEALAGILISAAGDANMTMTGGTLELTDWGAWWGNAEGSTGTFDMSGGTVNYTGGPGIMELAWQPDSAPVGSSVGIWNMTGGEINAKGIDMPGDGEDGNPGSATINLHGGTINVGAARGGLMMYEGARIDIRNDGRLVLEGDQLQVEDYIANGWITAYDGSGELVLEFDGLFTILTAMIDALAGDCNGDGLLDAADLACVSTVEDRDAVLMNLNSLPGDLDGNGQVEFADFLTLSANFNQTVGSYSAGDIDLNGTVDFSDFLSLSANFGQVPPAGAVAAAVPEPSALGLGLLGLLVLTRRRSVLATPARPASPLAGTVLREMPMVH